MGYEGVEAAGFYGLTPAEFKAEVEAAGLQVVASHSPWANRGAIDEAVETAKTFGLDVVAGGFGPDAFETPEAINETVALVNELTEALKPMVSRFYLHNHAWEFDRHDGVWGHSIIAEQCPDVLFEIDTYWAANFGANNPAEAVTAFAKRTPFLHIKDGTMIKGEANVALGQGKMNFSEVLAAAGDCPLRALIVEFDRCDTIFGKR